MQQKNDHDDELKIYNLEQHEQSELLNPLLPIFASMSTWAFAISAALACVVLSLLMSVTI